MYKIYRDENLNIKIIVRTADTASIPEDPDNGDYREYLAWLEEGNEPEPWVDES